MSTVAVAQESADDLKSGLNDLYGKERLELLIRITDRYLEEGSPKKAFKYAKEAAILADDIIKEDNSLTSQDDLYLKPMAYLNLGIVHLQRGQFMESREALETALADAERWSLPNIAYRARWNLDAIHSETSDTSKVKKSFLKDAFRSIGDGVNKTTAEMNVNATLKLALYYENNQNYPLSIEYYQKAIDLLKKSGEWTRVFELEEHIAGLLEKDGQYDRALEVYEDIETQVKRSDDSASVQRVAQKKNMVTRRLDSASNASLKQSPIPSYSSGQIALESDDGDAADLRRKAEEAEKSEDYQQSLFYFKEYLEMEQQLAEEKRLQELALLEKINEIENRDREITMLKQNEEINALKLEQNQAELNQERTFKQNLAISIGLLAALVLALYLLYRNKRRDHRKLGVAYADLKTTRDNLEVAEQRIKSLLHQQVSDAVANELLATTDEKKVERRYVCIMFLDIRDFTPFAENRGPEEIIEYQNLVFGFMIDTVNKYGGIVNQILGDGFMATFGAPVSSENDCLQAYLAATEIIGLVNEKSAREEIPPTKVGIGLHAGYVVAGNVGTRNRKQYSITGNTVILASRLEQLNKEYGTSLVLSKEVYDKLPEDHQDPVEFKAVKVKGRSGPMEVASF